jgi:hypothetical protein
MLAFSYKIADYFINKFYCPSATRRHGNFAGVHKLLQELLEIQQRRTDKMCLNLVRVSIVGSGQFYATLKITNEEIIIKPDDPDRLPLIFYDCHLNGYHATMRVEEMGYYLLLLLSEPSTTRRHGNFAEVHTLLRIILSSNSAVLINIITGVSPPHFDFFVFYILCQC